MAEGQVADSSPLASGVVDLNNPSLKYLDDNRLESIPTNELLNLLNQLSQVITLNDFYVREQTISGAPRGLIDLITVKTTTTRFSEESNPNASSLYFIEAVIWVYQIGQAVAARINDHAATDYSRTVLSQELHEWLAEITESNVDKDSIDEGILWSINPVARLITFIADTKQALLGLLVAEQSSDEESHDEDATSDEPPSEDPDATDDDFGHNRRRSSRASDEDSDGSDGGEAEEPTDEKAEEDQRKEEEKPPEQATSPEKYTAPKDALALVFHQNFQLATNNISVKGKRLSSSADARRQFSNESAWVFQGVLAQLYPEYIGKMDQLDPRVIDQVRETVIAEVGKAAASGDLGKFSTRINAIRAATLKSMSNLQTAGLAVSAPLALTTSGTGETVDSGKVPSRSELIDQQIAEVAEHLSSQLREANLPAQPADKLQQMAYEQLATLSTDDLIGIAVGAPIIRQKRFGQFGKNIISSLAAEGALTAPTAAIAYERLNAVIAARLADGATAEQIIAELNALPNEALEVLVGVEISDANIAQVRVAIQEQTVQRLITVFNVVPSTARPGIRAADALKSYSSQAAVFSSIKNDTEEDKNNLGASSKGTHKKVQAFLKGYQRSWMALSQEEQIVVYMLAELPVNDQLFSSSRPLGALPLPFEFVNFAFATQGREFKRVVDEFALDPSKFKNRATQQAYARNWAKSKTTTEAYGVLLAIEQERRRQQLDMFDSLSDAATLKLALELGYGSIEALQLAMFNHAEEKPVFANNIIEVTIETTTETQLGYRYNPMADEAVLEALLAASGDEIDDVYNEISDDDPLSGQFLPGEGQVDPAAFRKKIKNPRKMIGNAAKAARDRALKRKMAGQAVQQGAKAAAQTGAKLLAGAAATAATLGLAAIAILSDKKLREAVLGGGLFFASTYLYALGTVGGLIGSVVGGIGGFLAGSVVPGIGNAVGAIGGNIAGTYIGASLFPARWMNSRVAPFPGAEAMTQSVYPSASSAATGAGAGTAASATTTGATTTSGASAAAPAVAAGTATGATVVAGATATATTAGVATTAISALSAGLAPMIAMGTLMAASMFVLLVIWGAFLVNTPTAPVPLIPPGNIEENPYIRVVKRAAPNKIENGEVVSITYTVSIEAKTGYLVKLTSLTDTFTAVGEQPPDGLTSPISLADFGEELISTTVSKTYQVEMSGIDAYVTNRIVVQFDAYETLDQINPIATNQTVRAGAYVIIGNPKIGCWPASGKLVQDERGTFSHNVGGIHLEAMDVLSVPQVEDLRIYAPYPGTACAKDDRYLPNGGFDPNKGYGLHIVMSVLIGGEDAVLYFGHFNSLNDMVRGECREVGLGEVLGIMGDTGFSSGVHLHYEIRNNPTGIRDIIIGGREVQVGELVYSCFSQE